MAEGIIQKAGGGISSDEVTAGKAQVLTGYTALTKDSGDEAAEGTMANRGAVSSALNCGGSYTVPAGYHNGAGKVTANSLASQTGGATAEDKYVLNGKTYWKDGVKRTGSMTVASVASFSVAPYSTSQVLATWKNPSRGPYSGVAICAKTGGYPANINDGRVYTGAGSNSVVNGTSSQVISGLAAGQTYYFRIWVYCTCSAGDQYSGYLQASCVVTAHGRAAFTSSGTWTVPAGIRNINIHCTGGGSCGANAGTNYASYWNGGGGGGGGYTSYSNNISVSPGEQIKYTVGSGGTFKGLYIYKNEGGGESKAERNGVILVSAKGGCNSDYETYHSYAGIKGGSYGGKGGSYSGSSTDFYADNGGSDGNPGQNTTTREFGTGTLYSGGGGGGSGYGNPGTGGAGGGGMGGTMTYQSIASAGSSGTGGGGGGAGTNGPSSGRQFTPGQGGSGNVVITW